MANFIYNFSTSNPIMFNGKIIPVSVSNPWSQISKNLFPLNQLTI
jgi:hypothetical protein